MFVASAVVGPVSGCETMGTGLRLGCMWRYSCPFRGGTFLLVTQLSLSTKLNVSF